MLKDTGDKNYYEVLWYEKRDFVTQLGDVIQDETYFTKSFRTAKAAMNYYNKHKDDQGKYGWWVTYRDVDGCVLDDLVY